VINVDLVENTEADFNTLTSTTGSLKEQGESIQNAISQVLGGEKLSAIFCVAGGWAGGNAHNKGTRLQKVSFVFVLTHQLYRILGFF
jgi:dihydropteridine reductase